jgi:hypothetical protein
VVIKQKVLDIRRVDAIAVLENRAEIGPGLRRHPSEPSSTRALTSGKRGRDEPSGAGADEETAEGSAGDGGLKTAPYRTVALLPKFPGLVHHFLKGEVRRGRGRKKKGEGGLT